MRRSADPRESLAKAQGTATSSPSESRTCCRSYTSSEQARANFRLAVKIALAFVALIWLIQLLNWGVELKLGRFGVRPRELAELPGKRYAWEDEKDECEDE